MSVRKKLRKLVVDGARFDYRVGRSSAVIRRDADGEKVYVSIRDIVPDKNIERGRWKKTSDGSVLPSEIAAWIREHFRRTL